jgi:hypothetical protein
LKPHLLLQSDRIVVSVGVFLLLGSVSCGPSTINLSMNRSDYAGVREIRVRVCDNIQYAGMPVKGGKDEVLNMLLPPKGMVDTAKDSQHVVIIGKNLYTALGDTLFVIFREELQSQWEGRSMPQLSFERVPVPKSNKDTPPGFWHHRPEDLPPEVMEVHVCFLYYIQSFRWPGHELPETRLNSMWMATKVFDGRSAKPLSESQKFYGKPDQARVIDHTGILFGHEEDWLDRNLLVLESEARRLAQPATRDLANGLASGP